MRRRGGWRRSTFHVDGRYGDCVEVRQFGDGVVGVRGVRDERCDLTAKLFAPETWEAFVKGVKAGEFDLEADDEDEEQAP
jgi:hypothetical protein